LESKRTYILLMLVILLSNIGAAAAVFTYVYCYDHPGLDDALSEALGYYVVSSLLYVILYTVWFILFGQYMTIFPEKKFPMK
jgi:hypothetical protein